MNSTLGQRHASPDANVALSDMELVYNKNCLNLTEIFVLRLVKMLTNQTVLQGLKEACHQILGG